MVQRGDQGGTLCSAFSEGDLSAACNDVPAWRGTRKGEELLKQRDKSRWCRAAGDSVWVENQKLWSHLPRGGARAEACLPV